MEKEMIIVLDFGGQYNQLIARRVRECNVYCEVHSYNMPLEQIKEMNPKGIIFTGGPNSVYGEDSASCPKEILNWVFRFWESAMARSSRRICSGARWQRLLSASTVRQRWK